MNLVLAKYSVLRGQLLIGNFLLRFVLPIDNNDAGIQKERTDSPIIGTSLVCAENNIYCNVLE